MKAFDLQGESLLVSSTFCHPALQQYQPIQVEISLYSSHLKFLICREYNRIFDQLRTVDLEKITELTNCSKPCHYNKYSFITDGEMSALKSEKFLFSLWAVSHYTKVSTEQLIYPVTSLIAEFGGALGLFLGISFMSIWENFHLFGLMYKLVSK